jgi:hypothetical protein
MKCCHLANVCCYSNSDRILRRSEMTRCANSGQPQPFDRIAVEGSSPTKPYVGKPCKIEGNLGTSLDLVPRDELAAWMMVADS